MKSLKFAELKELLQRRGNKETLSCANLPSGIPKGAITEVTGSGKTEFVQNFLAEHPSLTVAWIEKSFSIFPYSFVQRGVRLSRLLFVDAQKDVEWTALQILRAQAFGAVVIYGGDMDLQGLRRLQLAAEKSDVCAIWLTPEPQSHWATSLQVTVRRTPDGILAYATKRRF